jgi:hypothetical protein
MMNHHLKATDVTTTLAAIRQDISDANHTQDAGGDAAWRVQSAYIQTRILLEVLGLTEALKAIEQIEAQATASKWDTTEIDDEVGEPFLLYAGKLHQYLRALENMLGEPKATTVAKDVVQILRATQYSITDKSCFPNPPANETEVHNRVEAVLRCVFPDLLHKPPIAKQIKNFQPDTGLPSIHTLIEYKFMSDQGEEKRIADEVLADTRGYVSDDWTNFIYVVYETKRIKPESQWRQLLRQSGVGANTDVVVISGEEPRHSTKPKYAKAVRGK